MQTLNKRHGRKYSEEYFDGSFQETTLEGSEQLALSKLHFHLRSTYFPIFLRVVSAER